MTCVGFPAPARAQGATATPATPRSASRDRPRRATRSRGTRAARRSGWTVSCGRPPPEAPATCSPGGFGLGSAVRGVPIRAPSIPAVEGPTGWLTRKPSEPAWFSCIVDGRRGTRTSPAMAVDWSARNWHGWSSQDEDAATLMITGLRTQLSKNATDQKARTSGTERGCCGPLGDSGSDGESGFKLVRPGAVARSDAVDGAADHVGAAPFQQVA
jgi:hypothetical protein